MSEHAFALYNAFSAAPLGGSVAAIIADSAGFDAHAMQRMACELGVPATAFVAHAGADTLEVRFFSTLTEYPMCGHAALALGTWLVEEGIAPLPTHGASQVRLITPAATNTVHLSTHEEGRVRVMLGMAPSSGEPCTVGAEEVATLFGIAPQDIADDAPIEVSRAEFTHVMVPVATNETLEALRIDFDAITRFSHLHGVDTVCVFARRGTHGRAVADRRGTPHADVRVREFCPAVGTPESSGAGTTNRALACYLHRHGLIAVPHDGTAHLRAEQGVTLGRPASIHIELDARGGNVAAVRVGGLATRIVRGTYSAA